MAARLLRSRAFRCAACRASGTLVIERTRAPRHIGMCRYEARGYHARVQLVRILFGSGWWMVWQLFILGSIIPMLLLLRHLRKSPPEEEPQGGQKAYFSLLGIAFSLVFATVVDAAILGWKIGALRGTAWGTIAGLAFCLLWTVVLFGLAKKLSVPKDDEETPPLPATITFAIWHAGFVVVNLIVLYRIHG